jgi:hypothetical protein
VDRNSTKSRNIYPKLKENDRHRRNARKKSEDVDRYSLNVCRNHKKSATASTPPHTLISLTLLRTIDTDKHQKPKGKHAETTATKKDEPDKQKINTAAKKDDT